MLSGPTLPNPNDPVVRAEAIRAARTVAAWDEAHDRGGSQVRCRVRVLGHDGGATLVHAECGAQVPGRTFRMASETPRRIEADGTVRIPGDGTLFEPELRRLFGTRLARWYSSNGWQIDDGLSPLMP